MYLFVHCTYRGYVLLTSSEHALHWVYYYGTKRTVWKHPLHCLKSNIAKITRATQQVFSFPWEKFKVFGVRERKKHESAGQSSSYALKLWAFLVMRWKETTTEYRENIPYGRSDRSIKYRQRQHTTSDGEYVTAHPWGIPLRILPLH